MRIFSELADWYDNIRKENDSYLDELYDDWITYAVEHADDPVWYASLRNVAIYTGTGLLDGAWKLTSGLASGFLDTLRIGDGVKKGGWGYAQDAVRVLVVAGPALRAARFGLSTLASINSLSGPETCAWVSATKALRLAGVKHFATVEDLAKAAGMPLSDLEGVKGLSEVLPAVRQLGGVVRDIAPLSANVTTSLLAATEGNPNGVVMFAVRWMNAGIFEGHVMLATRNMVTGALQILDRSGRVVSSLAELDSVSLYPGIRKAAFVGSDIMAVIENATAATAMDRLAKATFATQLGSKLLDERIPEERQLKERWGVDAVYGAAPLLKHIGLEVRQVPFRAEIGRRIHVPTKPIVLATEKTTVSSTVCIDLYDSEARDGVAITKRSKHCVTSTYEYQLHAVKHGESLSKIAKRYYGTEKLWPMVYQANRALLGRDPHKPESLRPGMKLHIVMSSRKDEVDVPLR